MESTYAATWETLDNTLTWQDVDYSDVPKFVTKWQDVDYSDVLSDKTMNSAQLDSAKMVRALRKRRIARRTFDDYARAVFMAVVDELESQTVKKHYEPYLRFTDSSPPQPDKHLYALGSITNLDPPITPTALSGITTAGTPVGALYGLS
jgi:hypothetical protein